MSSSWVGASHTVEHRVIKADLVTSLFPGVVVFEAKPPVMATGLLGALCEWPAMEAIRARIGADEDSLGTGYTIDHLRAVQLHTLLRVTATCVEHTGRASVWSVHVTDGLRTIATARAAFVVVDIGRFTAKHLSFAVPHP